MNCQEGKDIPTAANVLRIKTYVGAIVSGVDSEEDKNLQSQFILLLNRGQFVLRKCTSNSTELLQSLP